MPSWEMSPADIERSRLETERRNAPAMRVVGGAPGFFTIAAAVAVGVFIGAWLFAWTYGKVISYRVNNAVAPFSSSR